ncbi:hypothetical protein PN462_15665 [Spirulina sp. CS-785/01]|uniref:DUF6737 family protein n=1 Tax=Spirulina sp. CS-785/01 TaxID=3021716 RepID=UPI00232F3DB5|nr:DUF6737 family protein [Spirulina sp. CS-785/01]MDB9314548.1 hypothetical protein [Spirulina sp. CS-785/01]
MSEPSKNFWDYKPGWCQPWSILLTGGGIILGSWLGVKIWWIATPITGLVLLWWLYFLILVPWSFRQSQMASPSDQDTP